MCLAIAVRLANCVDSDQVLYSVAPDLGLHCLLRPVSQYLGLLRYSLICYTGYHIYHKYWKIQTSANSKDPDQMPQNVASDQGLHCLPFIQQFLDPTIGSKMDVKILGHVR